MKVLVAGGAGYIGSHVCLDLLAEGHEVSILDDLSTGCRENICHGTHFFEASILEEAQLREILVPGRFEAVVHLAALKAAGDSMVAPETFARHNLSGSINLLNAASRAGVARFVFSSSAAVYGDPEYTPIDEKHPQEPVNFYGFTKLEFERILHWFHRLKGMSYCALRYFNAAGYDSEGRIRGLERNPKNLIPLVMEVARGKMQRLSVFGDDYPTEDGTCIRDYIHVTDLARAHTQALDWMALGGECFVGNLGTGQGHSVLEVVEAARQITGKPIPYEITARRPGDPPSLVASADSACLVLQWRPTHSDLKNILATTWPVYSRQPG